MKNYAFFFYLCIKITQMALTTATIDFDANFRYDLATKQLIVTDTTDYATAGVATSDVTVIIKAETAGGGIFYNNVNHAAPDIDPDVSLDSTIVIPLPLDGSALPVHDNYTVTLEWQDTTGVAYEVTKAKTFTLDYVSPTVELSMEVDCLSPQLSTTDETNYTIDGIDPSITRAIAIHYPPSVPTADVTGTGAVLTTSSFYTVADSTIEHSSSLTSTLIYDFGGGFIVYDEVTGSEVIQVACEGDVCTIYCCFKTLYNKYIATKGKNNVLEQDAYYKMILASTLAQYAFTAIRCGKSSDVSTYISTLLEIADCNAGCGCDDGTPQLVTGLGVSASSITVTAGTGITVVAAAGNYTVSLSSTNIAKLAAMYNTVVAAGTNTSITSASVTAGGVTTTTYTVNATDTVPDILLVEYRIEFSITNVPTITEVLSDLYGANLDISALSLVNDNNTSAGDWQSNLNSFTLSSFFSGAPTNYYPEIVSMEEVFYGRTIGVYAPKQVNVDIYRKTPTNFRFRFTDAYNGGNLLGREINNKITSIKLIIKINA